MYGMPSFAVCSLSLPATSRHSCSLSSVSGPGNEEQGLVQPDVESAESHLPRRDDRQCAARAFDVAR